MVNGLLLIKPLLKYLDIQSEQELMQVDVNQIYFDESDRKKLIEELENHEQIENYKIKLKRKDGTAAVVSLNDRIVNDDSGEIYLEGNISDITDQVKAEEERLRSIEEYVKAGKRKNRKISC